MKKEEKEIGNIGNYYGGLVIKSEDGKYFWGIESYDGTKFEDIPKELFDALEKYALKKELK